MQTLWFSGLLISMAVGFVLAAVFFVHAWLWRRHEGESLLFGLGTLAIAVYTFAVGMFYFDLELSTPASERGWANLAVGSGVVALVLTLHFGLRFVAVRRERLVMTIAYPVAGCFVVLLLSGYWWTHIPQQRGQLQLLGVAWPIIRLRVHWPAVAYYVTIPIVIGAVSLLIARRWRAGQIEMRSAWVGSLVLGAGAINDALALGAGWYRSVSLLPLGYAVFIHGVSMTLLTRYGRLSSSLRLRTDEVARRSTELERAVARLERAQQRMVEREQLAVLGQLAGVVAREVRQPIAAVLRAARAIDADRPAGDAALALLDVIEQEVARLDRLVGELLDFARPLSPQRTPTDLRLLLEEALAATDGDVRTSCHISAELSGVDVAVDGPLLRLAFDNIVRNAVDAMAGKGEIHIELRQRDVDGVACAEIDLRDTGEGMTAQQSEQALSPLFTTRVDGAGLGLPIAARVVEAHGGALDVRSVQGHGTTVRVMLPLDPASELPGVARRPISSRPPA